MRLSFLFSCVVAILAPLLIFTAPAVFSFLFWPLFALFESLALLFSLSLYLAFRVFRKYEKHLA